MVIVITEPTPYVPLAVVEETSATVGAVVSMAMLLLESEPVVPGAGRVRAAALGLVPTVSKIVPPLRVSAVAETSSSGLADWPAATV